MNANLLDPVFHRQNRYFGMDAGVGDIFRQFDIAWQVLTGFDKFRQVSLYDVIKVLTLSTSDGLSKTQEFRQATIVGESTIIIDHFFDGNNENILII
ncbi:8416_t:CDS:2 [Funneliformis geosporum]|nr:8416_t:CDS:2 [Funneliformis geosporum]